MTIQSACAPHDFAVVLPTYLPLEDLSLRLEKAERPVHHKRSPLQVHLMREGTDWRVKTDVGAGCKHA